jgi:hypothetical protein
MGAVTMESVQLARVADLGDMTQQWFWDSADPVTNQPSGWVWLDRTARGTERRYIQKSDADKKTTVPGIPAWSPTAVLTWRYHA